MPTEIPLGEKEGVWERVIVSLCSLYIITLVVVIVEGNGALESICQVASLNLDHNNLEQHWYIVSPLV
jgi:hypothetical protein